MTLPATTDPALPDIGGLGYVGEADASNYIAMAAGAYFRNASNLWVPVSASNPLPTQLMGSIPAGAAIVGKVGIDQTTEGTTNGVVRKARWVASTILNAATVPAGADSGYQSLVNVDGTESEVYLGIIIDQQPWSLLVTNRFAGAKVQQAVFPVRNGATTTHVASTQALSLVLGAHTSNGLTAPTTMREAKDIAIPIDSSVGVQVRNSSAVTATVTIKMYRVWR